MTQPDIPNPASSYKDKFGLSTPIDRVKGMQPGTVIDVVGLLRESGVPDADIPELISKTIQELMDKNLATQAAPGASVIRK